MYVHIYVCTHKMKMYKVDGSSAMRTGESTAKRQTIVLPFVTRTGLISAGNGHAFIHVSSWENARFCIAE